MVVKVINFEGEVMFDASRSDVTPRKLFDFFQFNVLALQWYICLADCLTLVCQGYTQSKDGSLK